MGALRKVLIVLAACLVALAPVVVRSQENFLHEDTERGLTSFQASQSGRDYAVYVDAQPGEDISVKLQEAIDQVRGHGGMVVLPPGHYTLSQEVCLAGTLQKFPKGSVVGVILEGNGAKITWKGPDEGAVIDLPGPYNCVVRNLSIRGERDHAWRKVIGIRYRGGVERHSHGGKNNRFENIVITNLGIGFEVGGLFGPDLVGGTFINTTVTDVRIGYRLMGCNVTSMVFINPLVAGFEEAGFQIKAFGGRQVRTSENEPIVQRHADGRPGVLMDPDEEREIFQTDLPAWLSAPDVTYPTWWSTNAVGPRVLWAGGGGLDVTIYGLLGHSSYLNSWVIDTNWGHVRVYSARIEGMGGIFRSSVPMGAGNYANVLVDVGATSAGGLNGNAIELYGAGPLYLIGGTYCANIALGGQSLVYSVGTRFYARPNQSAAFLPPGFAGPLDKRIERTGEARGGNYGRGQVEVVRVAYQPKPGFTNLPGSTGARLHELTQSARLTATVAKERTSVEVPLTGLAVQPDANYQVAVTPNFNAGGIWVSRKERDGLTVNFNTPAPADAAVDVLVVHDPFHGTETP